MLARTDALMSQAETGKIKHCVHLPRYGRLSPGVCSLITAKGEFGSRKNLASSFPHSDRQVRRARGGSSTPRPRRLVADVSKWLDHSLLRVMKAGVWGV